MADKVWLRGEYEFASLFSYRLPDFSSAYAPTSPMPGPSAVKLALVATAIEASGKVADGERIFDIVRNAKIGLQTSESLAISRVLLKRLKQQPASKAKSESTGTCSNCGRANQKLYPIDGELLCRDCGTGITTTYGTREYVHFGGAISIYIEVGSAISTDVARMMSRLRRIGTSDSLLYCKGQVGVRTPNQSQIARMTLEFNNLTSLADLAGRPAFRLKDIREGATFAEANPFSGVSGKNLLEEKYYVFPLRVHKQGRNWVWYHREPFKI
jgi:CRISPR-associated Cas5-like protein